jgi:hypothetical protein
LTDDSGANQDLRLSRYLTFAGLNNDEVTVPTSITVLESSMSSAALQLPRAWELKGISPVDVDNWSFRWASANNKVDDVRLSLLIPLEAGGDLLGQGLGFVFEFSGDGGTSEENWHSGTLRARDVPIVGNERDRLYLGSAAFELCPDDHGFLLVYEADPQAELQLGGVRRLHLKLSIDVLYVRFSKKSVTVHNYASTLGTPLTLRLELKFPLVMAPVSGSTPEALALILPLLDEIAEELLSVNFDLTLGASWDADEQVIASYDATNDRWSLSEDFWKETKNHPVIGQQINDAMSLGGFDWSLSDLLGEAFGAVSFRMGPDPYARQAISISVGTNGQPKLDLRTLLVLTIGPNIAQFRFMLSIDLMNFRLSFNEFLFSCPPSLQGGGMQVIDVGVLALLLPERVGDGVDGVFDFEKREFVLKSPRDPDTDRRPAPILTIPGGLAGDLSQRLLFELQSFSPDEWPGGGTDPVYLRINSSGLSLYAKVIADHRPNVLRGSDSKRPLGITPLSDRGGRLSEIVLIDNVIRKAVSFWEFEIPSVDDLVANVEVGMRQEKRGKPPIIYAEVDLDKQNGKPIAPLSAGYLQMQIDDLRARLEWNLDNDEWDLDVFADASLFLSSEISNTGGLDDLKDADKLQVRNVNLLKLHEGVGEISLTLAKPLEFKCLDEKFLITFFGVRFQWGHSFVFMCDEALIQWLDKGTLEVSVEVGGVYLEFSGGNRLKMRNPSRIGIDVTVSDSVRYRGEVAWVDNDREHYFAAAGTLAIEGLPEAQTLLKLGSGKKRNGQIVPNIVLYGSLDYEMQLFSGVVAKNFGAGIGINNRLTGIDERPTAEKLLANIDKLDPARISGWTFVERNGFYLSIVGTTIIASNTGGNTETNVYVASLLLSIDVDLNIVAAGKLWLASSVDFVRQRSNWTRPALVGAVAILPRERLLTPAIESRPNPAIESSKQLQEILNNGHIKLSFTLSPKLVDFFLEDVSYRYEFLGVQMLYRGSFRLAYFDNTLMVRASQMITGEFARELSAGPGGFRCRGDVAVAMEFGGLLSRNGIAAYGLIAARLNLDVSAWIKIEFSFTIGCGRWKKRISFSKTFNLPSTRLELGLMGAVAFDESGSFGFAGELSISISICGYRLSIAPSLAFNDGVIKNVRQRVAAFEGRLEAYRQQLLTGGQRGISGPVFELHTTADVVHERWLHYRAGNWHLIIPAPDEAWLTPSAHHDAKIVENGRFPTLKPDAKVPFYNHVVSMSLKSDADDPQSITLLMPWDTASLESEKREKVEATLSSRDLLEDVDLMMAETVSLKPAERVSLKAYKQVSDPRVESSVREYWLDIDQVMLPEGVLPVRMKSAEQILQSGESPEDFNSTYGRLVEYAWWSQRAIIQRRHQGSDRLEMEDLEHRRAVMLYQLLSELRELKGLAQEEAQNRSKESPWQARTLSEAPNEKLLFGVVFYHDGELNPVGNVIRKVFDPESGELKSTSIAINLEPMFDRELEGDDGELTSFGAVTKACNQVHLLPLRQEFIVDREATNLATGSGRLRVRLPVRFDNEFLAESLPVTSHFQVWRRLRGTSPVLVADQQLVPITFLEPEAEGGPAVAVIDPFLATDEFEVVIKGGEKSLQIPGIPRAVFGKTILEYAIKLIPVGDFDPPRPPEDAVWQSISPYVPEEDTFPVDLAMVFDVDALFRSTTDSGLQTSWTEFNFASIRQEEQSSYGEREANSSNVITLALLEEWKNFNPAAPTFELWVEERAIADSGFYAGAAEELGGYSGTGQDADLRRISGEEVPISLDDKFRLAIEPVKSPSPATTKVGMWRINANVAKSRFRDGFSYLFYIRPSYRGRNGGKEDVAMGRVRRLRMYLTRELPLLSGKETDPADTRSWQEPPRLRSVGRIEWIDASHAQEVGNLLESMPGSITPIEWQVPISASILPYDIANKELEPDAIPNGVDSDVLAAQRRRISMTWTHPGWRYGGVELNLRDIDDSIVSSSRVCETSDASIYQHAIRDFTNESAWRLTRREKSARLSLARIDVSPPDSWLPIENRDLGREYRIQQTIILRGDNPAIRELILRTKSLQEAIGQAQDWGPISLVATEWVRAINAYDRSALNLNDPELEKIRFEARALIRYLFLGLRPVEGMSVDRLTPDTAQSIDEKLNDLLLTIDEYQPDAADFDDSEDGDANARAAFLDSDFGRKLAAIVRRRRVIGEDVLATMSDPLPGSASSIGSRSGPEASRKDPSWLPRGSAFEELRSRQQEAAQALQRSFRYTQSLLAWFPQTGFENSWAANKLQLTLRKLLRAIRYERLDSDEIQIDWDRRESASRIVAKATGLTLSVQHLKRQFTAQGMVMDRRPHHRIIVRTDSDGTKIPEPVRLRSLLPSAERFAGEETPSGGGAESSIVALFNLYERMGFAIDLAATDRLGQTLSQRQLLQQIRQAKLEERFRNETPSGDNEPPLVDTQFVYVLAPREADSEYRGPFPDSIEPERNYAWVGTAFLRLVVVPKRFHELLLIHQVDIDENLTEDVSTELRDWLTMRGIDTTDVQEFRRLIAPFAKTLAFAHPRNRESKPIPAGELMLIRLTPMELHRVSVPHLDGFAHVDWELPNRHGHRFEVSARAMSRYEPLLSWKANAARPRMVHPGSRISVRRVMTRLDGVDLPIPQPVSVIPHPAMMHFVFSLSSAGIRSILNNISAVRTGYLGYSLNFQYKLIDHDDVKLKWERIRRAMIVANDLPELPDTPPVIISTPRNNAFDTRLFRNERLIQLDEIPYFYTVSLDVHSQFDGDLRGAPPDGDSELFSIPRPDPARRLPSVIAYRQAEVIRDESPDFEIEVVLGRLGELALPQELNGGIPLERCKYRLPDRNGNVPPEGNEIELWDDMLPDPALGYHFYYRVDDANQPESRKSVYRSVVDLLMPWHPSYKAQDIAEAPAFPFVRSLDSDIEIVEKYPKVELRKVTGRGHILVPVVVIKFNNKNKGLFQEPDRRRMQVSCRGRLTPATDLMKEQA